MVWRVVGVGDNEEAGWSGGRLRGGSGGDGHVGLFSSESEVVGKYSERFGLYEVLVWDEETFGGRRKLN